MLLTQVKFMSVLRSVFSTSPIACYTLIYCIPANYKLVSKLFQTYSVNSSRSGIFSHQFLCLWVFHESQCNSVKTDIASRTDRAVIIPISTNLPLIHCGFATPNTFKALNAGLCIWFPAFDIPFQYGFLPIFDNSGFNSGEFICEICCHYLCPSNE